MKFLKYLFFIVFIFTTRDIYANMVYPIQEMSRPECRFQNFSTLNGDCTMALPVLKTNDYTKYKNDYNLYRRVYTVLWGASYKYGWDTGNGGHSGVDIASARGTPVYSIYEGRVLSVGFLAGWGNTVKIEHTINGKKVYSNYSHLNTMNVKVGDRVSSGTQIGTVGSTGNSTGNHLHFQIDLTSANGPWYRRNCGIRDYNTIVNSGGCFDELNQNTVDPLAFLESAGAIIQQISRPLKDKISTVGLLTREEILRMEINEFLRNYNVELDIISFGKNIHLGKTGTLRVRVTNKRTNRPFNGSFPGEMNFKFDSKKMSIFPTGVLQIDNGRRDITITPKQDGNMFIDIYIGEIRIKRVGFGVIDTKKPIEPASVVFARNFNNVIGANNRGVLYLKNSNNTNIIGVPFAGELKISSPSGNMKFCIKKARNLNELNRVFNSNCLEEDFVDKIKFTYSDTIEGLLLYEYKVLDLGRTSITISKSNNTNIGTSSINGILPLGMNSNHPYYTELIELGKLGVISGVNRGYYLQDRYMTHEDGINFIKNALIVLKNRCTNNSCRNFVQEKLDVAILVSPNRFQNLTRLDFLKMIDEYMILPNYNGEHMIFRDLDNNYLNTAKNILKSNTWKDQFGPNRYFQPNKNITRGEGAYLIYNILR